jgi:hypothetical protein
LWHSAISPSDISSASIFSLKSLVSEIFRFFATLPRGKADRTTVFSAVLAREVLNAALPADVIDAEVEPNRF